MTMPTIFDVKIQPEEGDYFEPTAADYAGDDFAIGTCTNCGEWVFSDGCACDFCARCGLVKDESPSPLCDACDDVDYAEYIRDLYADIYPN